VSLAFLRLAERLSVSMLTMWTGTGAGFGCWAKAGLRRNGGLCDCQTGTSEKSMPSWGALFPFFLLVRLRALLHMRLFHVRLAGPRPNLTAIQDLPHDLAN
jgi:hypothetical protein